MPSYEDIMKHSYLGCSDVSLGGPWDAAVFPRTLSRGRAYVYVLPCRDRDLLKVGFARDPLHRFMQLHRRFHTFFDLDRGLLVAVDTVKQARAMERDLLRRFLAFRAMPPLQVREAAAGKTEWYAGVAPEIADRACQMATIHGGEVIAPLRTWLARRLNEHADRAFDWAAHLYGAIVEARVYGAPVDDAERTLALTMERYAAVGLPVRELFPDEVVRWYEDHYAFSG